MREPDILARLRSETRDLHKAVEKRSLMANLMSDSLTPSAYMTCLSRLEQFHASLDPELRRQLGTVDELQLPLRRKVAALRADLAHFNRTFDGPGPNFILDTEAEAWGTCYVIEGATLGGIVITKHLSRHVWLRQTAGRSYFAGYGATTGMMWTQFRMALVKASDNSECFVDLAIAAARRTFEELDTCLAAEYDLE